MIGPELQGASHSRVASTALLFSQRRCSKKTARMWPGIAMAASGSIAATAMMDVIGSFILRFYGWDNEEQGVPVVG